MGSRPEPSEIANRLALTATDPSVRAAAFRVVLRRTTTRDDEDLLLFAVGLHYRPDHVVVRRGDQKGSRTASSRRKGTA
jgi:hypothetical protein